MKYEDLLKDVTVRNDDTLPQPISCEISVSEYIEEYNALRQKIDAGQSYIVDQNWKIEVPMKIDGNEHPDFHKSLFNAVETYVHEIGLTKYDPYTWVSRAEHAFNKATKAYVCCASQSIECDVTSVLVSVLITSHSETSDLSNFLASHCINDGEVRSWKCAYIDLAYDGCDWEICARIFDDPIHSLEKCLNDVFHLTPIHSFQLANNFSTIDYAMTPRFDSAKSRFLAVLAGAVNIIRRKSTNHNNLVSRLLKASAKLEQSQMCFVVLSLVAIDRSLQTKRSKGRFDPIKDDDSRIKAFAKESIEKDPQTIAIVWTRMYSEGLAKIVESLGIEDAREYIDWLMRVPTCDDIPSTQYISNDVTMFQPANI